MERRIKEKTTNYVGILKQDIINFVQSLEMDESNENYIVNYIRNYTMLELTKDDFVRRKRVKNVVPLFERCKAQRANEEQCSRRSKENEKFCGTHIKSTSWCDA